VERVFSDGCVRHATFFRQRHESGRKGSARHSASTQPDTVTVVTLANLHIVSFPMMPTPTLRPACSFTISALNRSHRQQDGDENDRKGDWRAHERHGADSPVYSCRFCIVSRLTLCFNVAKLHKVPMIY
jgi:hypothetical protein